MDSTKLAARRQAVIDKHKQHEGVPQSPLSPQHPDMQDRDEFGKSVTKMLHSERPVAIQEDDRVFLCGSCAEKFKAACAAWDQSNPANETDTGIIKSCRKNCKKVAAQTGDVLELSTQNFNACLHALNEQGVLVVLTDMAEIAPVESAPVEPKASFNG